MAKEEKNCRGALPDGRQSNARGACRCVENWWWEAGVEKEMIRGVRGGRCTREGPASGAAGQGCAVRRAGQQGRGQREARRGAVHSFCRAL